VAASNAPLEKLGDMIAFRETFNEFLGKLKPEQRRIFLLRYWYMDKIEEISDKLGISENKVKVSLHRTRNKLKKLLEKEGLL
jgi:RNA polymerase sigma-70 factor (ECF subfamily)